MAHQKKRAPGPAPATEAAAPLQRRSPSPRWWLVGVAVVLLAAAAWVVRDRGPKRPNVLLVTIDTLRADHLGSYGYKGARTPVLDALAQRGARFENALATVPLTGPSHSSILTGLYPPVHGVRDNVIFPLSPDHPNLATLLGRQGYRTGAFVSAYPVAGSFGFSEGFDVFSEGFHEAADPAAGGAERPANETVDTALSWLAGGKEAGPPFFAWLHLYDPHTPYRPPAPFDAAFADHPYDGEIAFADAQLGRITEWLKASGHEADTVVVVVADHGESLGEHDEGTHAILIYQATLHVPFILAGPGVPENTVVGERVSTVDILPTLLGLLKLESPRKVNGRDLRPALSGQRLATQAIYSESLFARLNCRWSSLRSLVEGDWKLIQGSESELFNLADDPSESNNLAASDPERTRKMVEGLKVAVRSMAPGGDTARANAVSPEQAERLRSLGYTSGSGGAGGLDLPGLGDPRKLVRLYEKIQAAATAHGPAADRAVEEMLEITKIDPGNPYGQYALGNLAYRTGRLHLADTAYAKALELDPDRPGMRLTYGRLLRDLGRLEDSERQLRLAVEQTTADDSRTRVSLAETLVGLGKIDEAQPILKAVLDKWPEHLEALAAKGHLLVAAGKASDAIPFLEKAAAGGDPEPWVELARAHLGLGEAAKAREAGMEALRRSPGHPWALAVTGHALLLEGKRDQGLSALKQALAAQPRRPEAWLSLAAAFEAAGNPAQAAACRRAASAIMKR
jgi:arylsulfatase A-like enzyme/Tfp pilus assembly protein PilF